MTGYVTTALVLLADDAPRNSGPDFGKASPIGLLILVLLLIAVLLLGRSMSKHLRKVPETFDDVPEADPEVRERARKLHDAREAEERHDAADAEHTAKPATGPDGGTPPGA